jgi:hypothetical protein
MHYNWTLATDGAMNLIGEVSFGIVSEFKEPA